MDEKSGVSNTPSLQETHFNGTNRMKVHETKTYTTQAVTLKNALSDSLSALSGCSATQFPSLTRLPSPVSLVVTRAEIHGHKWAEG